MGRLSRLDGPALSWGEAVDLRTMTLIGRSASCQIQIPVPEISGVHAALRWSRDGWELSDLGSRNGTLLDGQPVGAGQWVPVRAGCVLTFGHPDIRWVLRSEEAPLARAVPADGGEARVAHGGLLALPSEDDPRVLISRDADGSWLIEDADGGSLSATAEATITVAGQIWHLELPEPDPRTPLVNLVSLRSLILHFEVSPDEEHVALRVEINGNAHPLGARAHHYLLLTLARLRRRDEQLAPADPRDHGWVAIEELQRLLRLEERTLNLQIFRIRRQFVELGLSDAQDVIERRRGTGQLRIGVARAEISVIGA